MAVARPRRRRDLRWGGNDPDEGWPATYRVAPHPFPAATAFGGGPGGEAWMHRAACALPGVPDMFPAGGDRAAVAAAVAVCAGCPVAAPCAQLCASMPADWRGHGVWAGRPPARRAVVVEADD